MDRQVRINMRYPFNRPMPRISSPFGWRIHPILKYKRHHNGVDYASATGTPVYAVNKGTVVFAGPSMIRDRNGEPAGGGYIVRIKFKNRGKWYTASYMHLKKGSIQQAGIKVGDRVTQGQKLAESGNTGESTGPHLHFEIQQGAKYIWTADGTRYLEPVSFIKARLSK
jgi:murein DD-endopeptidase MepM/ murein hydrolase activator NlpD